MAPPDADKIDYLRRLEFAWLELKSRMSILVNNERTRYEDWRECQE